MEQKPGWTYQFIDSLNMHIAVNDRNGIMYTEDKTMYTTEEAALLKKVNYRFPLDLHLVKKAFDGTVVDVQIK